MAPMTAIIFSNIVFPNIVFQKNTANMGLWRRIWPRHTWADQFAFLFTHAGLIGICFFQLLVVLPKYHESYSNMYCLHVAAALFVLIQVFTNMYKLILTNTTARSGKFMLPSVLHPGWTYCPVCQLNAPPRSHHCTVCDTCVIKRDHHCIFTGNCVGYLNHRYFIVMAFYLWLGCFYVVSFNCDYYFNILGAPRIGLALQFFCPMLAWTLGYVTMNQLVILLVGGVTFMAMFLLSCLLAFQVFFISRGQTQFECKKKIRDYSINLLCNWEVVLGKRWYVTWLSAFLSSPLPGDGTHFQKLEIQMSPISENLKSL